MNAVATYYYWIKIAALALIVILAILLAMRSGGRRLWVPVRIGLSAVLAAVAVIGILLIAAPDINAVWAVGLGALGIGLGFASARGSRFTSQSGKLGLERSRVAAWIWAVATILVALTLLFGSSYLFALAVLGLVFAFGAVLGQVVTEFLHAREPATLA